MGFKRGVLLGLGIGYVLGARAGRERYEDIMAWWREFSGSPTVQRATERTREVAGEGAKRGLEAVQQGAQKAGSAVQTGVQRAGSVVKERIGKREDDDLSADLDTGAPEGGWSTTTP